MERIRLHKIGPIEDCNVNIKDLMILTGAQASGKSTIAKAVFFFNNLKNLLFETIRSTIAQEKQTMRLRDRFIKAIRGNFLQIFGTASAMDPEMEIEYHYENENMITINYRKDNEVSQVFVELNLILQNEIDRLERRYLSGGNSLSPFEFEEIRWIISERIFKNNEKIIYIPAGRGMISLLSTQMNYLYSMMDDQQKRSLDYCTQSFLEYIFKIKPYFNADFFELIAREVNVTDKELPINLLNHAALINRKILKGSYSNISGNESLQISKDRSININYTSSGQQEAVWILNVLFYSLINGTRSYFIIEEPEAHLYPDAQKLITEFISLFLHAGDRVLLTTHSPYVLGSVNNLLYAKQISSFVDQENLKKICYQGTWLDFEKTDVFFLENGRARNCTDSTYQNIENDVIDGASEEINHTFEEMVQLAFDAKGVK